MIPQPIGKALQRSLKLGPVPQQPYSSPNGRNIEASPQQTEESSEPKRSLLERLQIESDCQNDDLEHQQRKQSSPVDIDQTGSRSNGSIIRGETMQWTISPPVAMPIFAPYLETRPTPARHMTDGRRTEDQDFDFLFPRRRSASNSRPPPAARNPPSGAHRDLRHARTGQRDTGTDD